MKRDDVLDDVKILPSALGDIVQQVDDPAVLSFLIVESDPKGAGTVVSGQGCGQQQT